MKTYPQQESRIFIWDDGIRLRSSYSGHLYIDIDKVLDDVTKANRILLENQFIDKYAPIIKSLLSDGYWPGAIIRGWLERED